MLRKNAIRLSRILEGGDVEHLFGAGCGSSVGGGLSCFGEALGLVRIASTFCTREAWHSKTSSNLTALGKTA